jgi:hypothetical protein
LTVFVEAGTLQNSLLSSVDLAKEITTHFRVQISRTTEYRWLLTDWLNIGPRWKFLAKRWEDRRAAQLKNHWYYVLQPRVQTHLNDHHTLAYILDQGCRRLPIPQFSLGYSEVTQKLNEKGILCFWAVKESFQIGYKLFRYDW